MLLILFSFNVGLETWKPVTDVDELKTADARTQILNVSNVPIIYHFSAMHILCYLNAILFLL